MKGQNLLWMLLGFCFALSLQVEAFFGLDRVPTFEYLKKADILEVESGFPGVDCIYVINLDRRPEKWQRVEILMRNYGFNPQRFSAIDGWSFSDVELQTLFGPYPLRLVPGEIGCLLSHLSVIKDAYDRGFNLIWVCEDDIEILRSPLKLQKVLVKLSQIDPKWDIFFTDLDSKTREGKTLPSLGSDFRPDRLENYPVSHYLQRTYIDKNLMKIGQRFGMYSQFISREGMKKILNYFAGVYFWAQIDVEIHYIPNLKTYSSTEEIVSVWMGSPFCDTNPER